MRSGCTPQSRRARALGTASRRADPKSAVRPHGDSHDARIGRQIEQLPAIRTPTAEKRLPFDTCSPRSGFYGISVVAQRGNEHLAPTRGVRDIGDQVPVR